ncbi:MAG: Gfo/Idh/MocA family oxidoreductase, partial [candidate division Zixibacteria bacterium]|nr:Gfo/Idh/MocA family oxidoreductase [candidate division Zixibacteria bacterium]
MIRIGILGIGFMGTTHFKAIKNLPNASVEAIFTRDEKKLGGDWRNIQGNFGSGGGMQDLTGIRTYREIDAILRDPDIDLIDICLPTAMHYDIVMQALDAGKHVLVEKPIALKLEHA